MNLIGIVGRIYYNRDEQQIVQVNDAIRKVLANYDDVVSILLVPTNDKSYVDIKMGEDKLSDIDKEKLDYILEKCDGFVVPGGSSWYQFDEYIINYAIRTKKPLLGICAGFQAICSMKAKVRDCFDMTEQMLDGSHYKKDVGQYVHENVVVKNTGLFDIVKKDKIMVNSLHHSCIDFEMVDLVISSFSKEGIVEAVELPNHPFFLGVQWHPEYLMDDDSKKIFDKFIDKVKELH